MSKKKGLFSKSYGTWDVAFVKWSVLCWTLFLLTVWPWLRNLVLNVQWYVWLVLGILFMIKPIKKYFS